MKKFDPSCLCLCLGLAVLGGCYESPSGSPDASDFQEEIPPQGGITGDPCSVEDDCAGVPGTEKICISEPVCFIPPTYTEAGASDGHTETIGFDGGYCSAVCTSDAECGAGAACTNLCGIKSCLKLCNDYHECRSGYWCFSGNLGNGSRWFCVSENYRIGMEID